MQMRCLRILKWKIQYKYLAATTNNTKHAHLSEGVQKLLRLDELFFRGG